MDLTSNIIDTALQTYAVNFSIGEGLAGVTQTPVVDLLVIILSVLCPETYMYIQYKYIYIYMYGGKLGPILYGIYDRFIYFYDIYIYIYNRRT